jgi:signal transduction histidine kinase
VSQNHVGTPETGHARQEGQRLQSEFVSRVAHELYTPLTAIKGYVELLLEDAAHLSEEHQEFLGLIKTNTDRLVRLIHELLTMTRLEAGRVTLKQTVCNTARLLHDVSHALAPRLAAQGQRLRLDCAAALPGIAGDTDHLTQILTTLLVNASRSTPRDGVIRVTAQQAGQQVYIDVQDAGTGFSPEEQDQLFTPFFRTTRNLPLRVREISLGLAVARALVELHGGSLTVVSAPGQGTTFRMTLPVLSEPCP